MKTQQELEQKAKQLELYLEGRTEPIIPEYSLEKTKSFLKVLYWVLDKEEMDALLKR